MQNLSFIKFVSLLVLSSLMGCSSLRTRHSPESSQQDRGNPVQGQAVSNKAASSKDLDSSVSGQAVSGQTGPESAQSAPPQLSHLEKAQQEFDGGQLLSALEWAQKAQSDSLIGQDLIQSHMLEGLVYELSQQPAKSIEPFRRALKFSIPHNMYEQVIASLHLSYNLMELNQGDEAYAYFTFVQKNKDWLRDLKDQILAQTLTLYSADQSRLSTRELENEENKLEQLIKKEAQKNQNSPLLAQALYLSASQFNESASLTRELGRMQKSVPLLVYAIETEVEPYSTRAQTKLIENFEKLEKVLRDQYGKLQKETVFRARPLYLQWVSNVSQAEDLAGETNKEWIAHTELVESTKTLVNQIKSRFSKMATAQPPGSELTPDAKARQRRLKIIDEK